MRNTEHSSSNDAWTRRRLLQVTGIGIGAALLNNDNPSPAPKSIEQFERGFSPLTQSEYFQLLAKDAMMPVPYSLFYPARENQLINGSFTVTNGATTIHKIVTNPNREISLHMLRAVIDKGERSERNYAVPLVCTAENGSAEVVIGGLDDGKHTISILQDPDPRYQLKPEFIDYEVQTPTPDSIFGAMYTHVPILGLRTDVPSPRINAPIFRVIEPQKKPDGTYEMTTVEVFTNENAGYSAEERLERYQRITDVEWSYKAKLLNGQSLIREECIFQGFHVPYWFGGQLWGSQPVIQISTDHNTYSDIRLSKLLYSPKGIILPPGMTTAELIASHKELQMLAERELQDAGRLSQRLKALIARSRG